MREVKFRGKRTDNGEWVYGDLFEKCCTGVTIIENGGNKRSDFYFVDPNTLGQFIDKLDHNGKELYEGDLINFVNSLNGTVSIKKNKLITYRKCNFVATNKQGTANYWLGSLNTSGIELVSNVHERPDLLE